MIPLYFLLNNNKIIKEERIMAKWTVKGDNGQVEIDAYDIEEAIRKFKDLNSSAKIEAVVKTSDY